MPINLFDPTFAPAYNPGRSPFLPPQPPSVLPEDESSALGGLMEKSLGGLAYIGKVLDKTFGARAVRGVLGGKPQELLSVLPFSDSLGISDENNTVHGKQLGENLGLLTPGDNSLENDLAGAAIEMALDPSMYIGAGVPKAVLGGLNFGARNAGRGLELATAGRVNPYTAVGGTLDAARRPVNALFDAATHGTWTREVQPLAQDVFDPLLKQGRQAADTDIAGSLVPLDKIVKGNANPDAQQRLLESLYQHVEGFTPEAQARLAGAGFAPPEIQEVLAHGDLLKQGNAAALAAQRGTGVVAGEFNDLPKWLTEAQQTAKLANEPDPLQLMQTLRPHQYAEYAPRSAQPFPDLPGAFGTQQRNRLSGVSEFQQARADELRGLPGGTIGINDLVRDPQFTGATRTLNDLQVEDHLTRMLTGYGAGPTPTAWAGTSWGDAAWAGARQQAKDLSSKLKALPDQARDVGMFNLDILGNSRAMRQEAARTVASGETVIKAFEPGTNIARPAAQFQQAGVRSVPITQVLNDVGLTHVDPLTGTPVAMGRLAQAWGLGSLNGLKDLHVPADVAADMMNMGKAWTTPAVVAPVVDMWDRFTNLFKASLTSPFPGFHVRNALSGMFNMWRDGVGPGAMTAAGKDVLNFQRGGGLSAETAARLYPGASLQEANDRFMREVLANGVGLTRAGQGMDRVGATPTIKGGLLPGDLPDYGGAVRPVREDVGGFLGGFVPEAGKVGQQLNPLNVRGVTADNSAFLPVVQGERLGNTTEDWIRMTHYLAKRQQGMTPAQAKLQTMKYQIDYGDLTEFEKNVMKRVFPWYTFSRKNLPPILEDLATKPGKLAATTHLVTGTRQPGEFVPNWIGEGAAVPVEGAPDGQKRFVASFGLPIEDELLKTIGSAAQGDVQRTVQQLFGMAQPIVKAPAEVATGTQMFSGRKLEDLRPYESFTLGGLVPEDLARRASQLVANSPASRAFSSLDKFADERKGLLPTLANTLTGVRVQDVEVDKVRERQAQELLQSLLRGTPNVRARTDVYVPKEQLGNLTQDQLLEYNLLREIEARAAKRSREARRERPPG